MDNFFTKTRRREIRELQIAPILDMLVAVIFFLLLSTSFIDFTKQTLPPSGVKTISDPLAPPPVNPKLFVFESGEDLKFLLRWSGNEAGEEQRAIRLKNINGVDLDILKVSQELTKNFKVKFPKETSLSLSFSTQLSYQKVISVMDGVRGQLPDLILVSYSEAQNARATTP